MDDCNNTWVASQISLHGILNKSCLQFVPQKKSHCKVGLLMFVHPSTLAYALDVITLSMRTQASLRTQACTPTCCVPCCSQ